MANKENDLIKEVGKFAATSVGATVLSIFARRFILNGASSVGFFEGYTKLPFLKSMLYRPEYVQLPELTVRNDGIVHTSGNFIMQEEKLRADVRNSDIVIVEAFEKDIRDRALPTTT